MKNLSSKKILIFSGIIFLSVLITDIIFVHLLFGKIFNINDKVRQIDLSSQERLKELNLRDAVSGTAEDRERLEQFFVQPGNNEVLKFTKFLEDLANGENLTHKKSLNYEQVTEEGLSGEISALRFRFHISGRWAGVYRFLLLIERLPKVVILNSVSLNLNSEDKNWTADLDFSVIQLKN